MDGDSKCPFSNGKRPSGPNNQQWWPDRLNLKVR